MKDDLEKEEEETLQFFSELYETTLYKSTFSFYSIHVTIDKIYVYKKGENVIT